MNIDRIMELVERYDNAATTREEEQELMQFFTSGNVPPHLQADRIYFLSLQQNREEAVPDGLEAKLTALIDQLDAQEQMPKPRSIRLHRRHWLSGIAAGVLILLTVGFHFRQSQASSPVLADTCATPEEAYQHTKNALLLFSSALNKGREHMALIPQTTAKVQESINEQINQFKN